MNFVVIFVKPHKQSQISTVRKGVDISSGESFVGYLLIQVNNFHVEQINL